MRHSRLRSAIALALVAVGCRQRPVTSPQPSSAETAVNHAPTSGSLQMLLVITEGWDEVPGVMRRYERDGARARWRAVGAEVPVIVGASGLGWGIGLHGAGSPGEPGPIKREGDNRSPAGVFRLVSTFGYAPRDSMSWLFMPYAQATDSYKCVDDAASIHYNQMLFSDRSPIDWRSAEDMH